MTRPAVLHTPRRVVLVGRQGYTLVEILTATALTLVMMTAVVGILASVSQSVSNSRSGLEMMDRLRATQHTLRRDLGSLTVTMLPPRRPEAAEGYFTYIEGPIGPVTPANPRFVNSETGAADNSVGDMDDVLIMTVRSHDVPFIGRAGPGVIIESQEAEIAWFVRGRTLYRRVLLIAPSVSLGGVGRAGFYRDYDLSVRLDGTNLVGNTLSDLTMPGNRFAHLTANTYGGTATGFPSHPQVSVDWTAGPAVQATDWVYLGLPTLRECSSPSWIARADLPAITLTGPSQRDLWVDPHPWNEIDSATGTLIAPIDYTDGVRIGEDVILTDVVGFDVKAWDPGAPIYEFDDTAGTVVAVMPGDAAYPPIPIPAGHNAPGTYTRIDTGAYVDLCYNHNNSQTVSDFAGNGNGRSQLDPTNGPFTYDTWSFHYEHDGIDTDGVGGTDQGANGFDDDNNGEVDDAGERETMAPYPVPLRGIQVKIRVFEPDSRQVREVTVVQEFLPK